MIYGYNGDHFGRWPWWLAWIWCRRSNCRRRRWRILRSIRMVDSEGPSLALAFGLFFAGVIFVGIILAVFLYILPHYFGVHLG